MKIETVLSEKLRRLGHRPRLGHRSFRFPVKMGRQAARLECDHCGQWAEMAVTKFGGELGLRMTGPAITDVCRTGA
jgi:hypothetical protein